MDHRETLRLAAVTLNDRGKEYGDPDKCFADAAAVASIMLRKIITKYDVVKIIEAVKIAREAESPHRADNYVDRINYVAFACQFSPAFDDRDANDEGLREIAARFAPRRDQVDSPPEG